MLRIGCHLSSAKGYLNMGKTAVEIGANTFQFFTRNPRGGSAKPLDIEDMKTYCAYAEEQFARLTMDDDLKRMKFTPGQLYNFHPGSHTGQGAEKGIEEIAALLNELLKPEQTTTVLLETMAGKGSEVGRTFEELRAILDGVKLSEKMGVCLDTCHVYDAGYDIVNHLDDVLEEFDRVIGLNRLKAIHLNDSKNPMGSHKDRHEKIGEGSIGLEAVTAIINHPSLKHLPFYLETPNELPGYQKEIELLKSMYQE